MSYKEYVFSPPGFSRQAYVMLLLLSFLLSFLTIAWSKKISETTGLIFTKLFRVIDMLV